jgi:hypothetical protein
MENRQIASHLARRPQCRTVTGQLGNVSNLLRSVHYAAMPQYLSAGRRQPLPASAPAWSPGRWPEGTSIFPLMIR